MYKVEWNRLVCRSTGVGCAEQSERGYVPSLRISTRLYFSRKNPWSSSFVIVLGLVLDLDFVVADGQELVGRCHQ